MTDERICVGALAGAFGVQGEARVKSFCAEPADIETYGPLQTEDGRRLTLTITRAIPQGFAVRLDGVTSKEQADALKGTRLYADRALLPSLPDDEFYHADLIGLTVVDTGGELLGQVSAVHNHGAGDLIEVSGPGLKTPALVPFTRACVPTIDLAAGRMVVDPPEGVFGG